MKKEAVPTSTKRPEGWPTKSAADLIRDADALVARLVNLKMRFGGKRPHRSYDLVAKRKDSSRPNIKVWAIFHYDAQIQAKLIRTKGIAASLAIREDGGFAETLDDAHCILRCITLLENIKKEVEDLEQYYPA
jgi:predicted transcriptional regulator